MQLNVLKKKMQQGHPGSVILKMSITLSSAIACGLALGLGREESVRMAKEYITGAIADGLDLGKGNGPLNHMYQMK